MAKTNRSTIWNLWPIRLLLSLLIFVSVWFTAFLQSKTLWDLLDLAIVPVVLIVVAAIFQQNERKKAEEAAKRERAALIGELLAEWISLPDEQSKLNKLTFEAFLWLPEDIAHDLSLCLSNKDKAPSIQEMLLKTRKYLLQNEDTLTVDEIIVFLQENKRKKKQRQENTNE